MTARIVFAFLKFFFKLSRKWNACTKNINTKLVRIVVYVLIVFHKNVYIGP